MGSSHSTTSALTTGSYSHNTVLSVETQIIVYLIVENSGVGTGVEIGFARNDKFNLAHRPVLFSLTDTDLGLTEGCC